MKKFLVLYRMDMAEMQKMMASTSAEERKKSRGVGGADEEEHGQLCRLWRACWKDKARRRRAVQLISGTILVVTQLYRQSCTRRLQPCLPTVRI